MKPLVQNTYVGKSPVHGWGVFAKKDIRKGGIIEECPFIFSAAEEKNPAEIQAYLFAGDTDDVTVIILGYGCVYNHSAKHSANYYSDDDRGIITFVASRTIKKDEEIFIDYGKQYWKSRGKKPR
jgi:SET domain-containing protein